MEHTCPLMVCKLYRDQTDSETVATTKLKPQTAITSLGKKKKKNSKVLGEQVKQ